MKCGVIGLGSFGSLVARSLFEQGAEVLAVDADQSKITAIKDHVTEAICAHLKDEETIKEIGIDELDTIIVALGDNFAEAALLTQILKYNLNIDRIIVQTTNSLQQEVLERVGADQVIFPEKESALKLADNLTTYLPNTTRITEDFAITVIQVPEKFVGKNIDNFHNKMHDQVKCIGLIRNGRTNTHLEEEIFEDSDELLVAGDPDELVKLND